MPGLIRGVARTAVVAGTATAVSGRVQKRQHQRWADQGRDPYTGVDMGTEQQMAEQAQPAAPAAPAADPIAQLKQLGELRDSGVLTEEEFAAQKAKILG